MAAATWEYRILTGQNWLTEDALNNLGAEGWELVSATSHVQNTPIQYSQMYSQATEIVCFFKRQQQSQQTTHKPGVY